MEITSCLCYHTLSIMSKTTRAAACASAIVLTNGAAWPRHDKLMITLKNIDNILPTVYSGFSVIGSMFCDSVHPYLIQRN